MTGVTDNDSTLDQALALAGLGYKLVPIPAREKFPKGLGEWQKKATDDKSTILDWWGDGERGIGWAMGRQPNGMNLAAIDVDVADGKPGKDTFNAMVRALEVGPLLRRTVRSQTGSGGYHFIVEVGDSPVTNGRLGPGLDLRGEGGFIVIPPSIHPNGKPYFWEVSPHEVDPVPAPANLIAFMLDPTAEGPDGVGTPSGPPTNQRKEIAHVGDGTDDTPATWAQANLEIGDLLADTGWSYVENKGEDSYWARPGKHPWDGHSAIVHPGGPMVVWSTEAPPEFWSLGSDNRDGSRSLSPFDVYAAAVCGGDRSEAGRQIRKMMPRKPTAPGSGEPGAVAVGGEPMGTACDPAMNLPDEFWESKPWLTKVRLAAQARLVSPDATLINILARYAALIPPTVRLPAIIGSEATFDFIGCTVASSSGGKTVANGVAAELLPIHRKDLLVDLPVGSGEGLIQSFLVPEVDEDGKETGRQVVGMTGIHFTVDEGTALLEQQARRGTTIVQTLCSAWSGATLGQANASIETRRIIEARRVRCAAVINIQTANGHLLIEQRLVAIGLPQRICFASAHSPLPDIDSLPPWPGELHVHIHPTTHSVVHIGVPDEIARELRQLRYGVATGAIELGALDGHQALMQLKIAGMMALIEGRIDIDPTDWELASQIVHSSRAVRNVVLHAKQAADRERNLSQAVAQAAREVAIDDYKERQAIDKLAAKIASKVASEGPESSAKLRRSMVSSKNRHRFDAALELAVERGLVALAEVEYQGQKGTEVRLP